MSYFNTIYWKSDNVLSPFFTVAFVCLFLFLILSIVTFMYPSSLHSIILILFFLGIQLLDIVFSLYPFVIKIMVVLLLSSVCVFCWLVFKIYVIIFLLFLKVMLNIDVINIKVFVCVFFQSIVCSSVLSSFLLINMSKNGSFCFSSVLNYTLVWV